MCREASHAAAFLPRRVVILAPPNVQSLEVAGPCEVFAFAGMKLREAGRSKGSGYKVEVASISSERRLRSLSGLKLEADCCFTDIKGPVDTLLIAGGMEIWRDASPDLLAWLRQQARTVRRLGAVCTGSFLLAQAGLLDGRRVTTHWYFSEQLAREYPRVTVDAKPIYIRDGNLSTSAGGTANLDLALGMVEEDLGTDIALRIARGLVLFVRRPGMQNQLSTCLAFQSSDRLPIRELPIFILENLGEVLSVSALAARAHMSTRNFARIFRQQYGETPASFVETLRVETAEGLVRESDRGLEEIADACGLGGPEAMRRIFKARFRETPAQMRARSGAGTASPAPERTRPE